MRGYMASSTDESTKVLADTIVERVPGFVEFYANHAQAGFTGFDIFVYLSEAAFESDGKIHLRQKARITMSPQQAILLSRFLLNAVQAYEDNFGKIPIPPDDLEQVN
jgi:hypothetical protein